MGLTMLHAVLNMPIDLWGDSELDKQQRFARYVEASEKIQQLDKVIIFERAAVATAAKEVLEEIEHGNLHDAIGILKVLAGEVS